jgi:alkylhydroperoxidase family enzyme
VTPAPAESPAPPAAAPPAQQSRFPLLSDDEAWKLLPPADRGAGKPLPAWARALAESLPGTTAALLELDYLQRTSPALDPVLRAKMRWVAARANRCAYTEACALADLRRAGLDEAGITALAGDHAGLAAPERAALAFARRMTLRAEELTDEEVKKLREWYGDRRLVAMVLLLAYANFQDRLLLTLGLPPEAGPALEPVDVHFKRGAAAPTVPPRRPPKMAPRAAVPDRVDDPEWAGLDFGALKEAMGKQQARAPRIRVPDWEEVRTGLPPAAASGPPVRIRWSLVCYGYQPELAAGWSACTRAFGQEARQDRVFEESLFWVVTRTLHCFY